MAIAFDTSRLVIALSADDAKPDVFINDTVGNVMCHMTKGFEAATFPLDQNDALTAAAHIPLNMGPGDRIDGWTFGFLQIARANLCRIFYAGRRHSEGSIGVAAHIPPALTTPVRLDGFTSAPVPWFRTPFLSFVRPMVNAGWGDHPGLRVQLRLRNSTTNTDNFLFQLQDEREFWSIFTAQDPAGALHHLGYFQWRVRWEFEFNWIGDKPFKKKSNSTFDIIKRQQTGAPPDGDIASLIANPAGPRMSEEFARALLQALRGARGPNRSENPGWFSTVPRDFFSQFQ